MYRSLLLGGFTKIGWDQFWRGTVAWRTAESNNQMEKKYSADKTFEICQDLKQKRAESKLGRSEYNGLSWGKRYVVGLYYSF